jgi:hypothetical protein
MILSVMQPGYLPWLGFFDRIQLSDVVVLLDHVTIEKNTKHQFANRNRVKGPQGALWLTIPVHARSDGAWLPINEVSLVDNQPWRTKHLQSLRSCYSRAPYFASLFDRIAALVMAPDNRLGPYTTQMIKGLNGLLGLERALLSSATLDLVMRKSDLIVEICEKVGADTYLSGPFGRDYLDLAAFKERGIEVAFHGYQHPVYGQLFGEFVSHLSIVDLMFNEGSRSLQLLSSSRHKLSVGR